VDVWRVRWGVDNGLGEEMKGLERGGRIGMDKDGRGNRGGGRGLGWG